MRRALLTALAVACGPSSAPPPPSRTVTVSVDASKAIATVDERFLSFALDTAQVAGAKWWSPAATLEVGGGQMPYPPFDFSRPKLRALTKELAPALLRIGGTEADRVFYDMSGGAPAAPPKGYDAVLTRAELGGAFDFARALGLQIFFTLNAGPGPRDAMRVWQPDNARTLLEYARDAKAPIALWELGNEINAFPIIFGLDFKITGQDIARDAAAAKKLVAELTPGVPLAAPSSAYWPVLGEFIPRLQEFIDGGGAQSVDVVTWHYYPQQSRRCGFATRRADAALMRDPQALAEVDKWASDVEKTVGGAVPIWLGETGNAQCGGEPGVSDAFVGGFWWLDELGRMARRGQKIVVRQTLAGSNYGLLDDATLDPNPDYWISVLWKRTMGARALAATSSDPSLLAYAMCARGGGVALALLNLDDAKGADVPVTAGARVYSLTQPPAIFGVAKIALNRRPLVLGADGSLPALDAAPAGGHVTLPPASYAIVIEPDAQAPACL